MSYREALQTLYHSFRARDRMSAPPRRLEDHPIAIDCATEAMHAFESTSIVHARSPVHVNLPPYRPKRQRLHPTVPNPAVPTIVAPAPAVAASVLSDGIASMTNGPENVAAWWNLLFGLHQQPTFFAQLPTTPFVVVNPAASAASVPTVPTVPILPQQSSPVNTHRDAELLTFVTNLLLNAQGNAGQRSENGRQDAGVCTLTVDDLLRMWHQQRGLCHYSSLPLQIVNSHQPWFASIERLHPSRGYTPENCAIVALEFNGFVQWSRSKVAQVPVLSRRSIDSLLLEFSVYTARTWEIHRQWQPKEDGSVPEFPCGKCGKRCSASNFVKYMPCWCQSCCNVFASQRLNAGTLRAKLVTLLTYRENQEADVPTDLTLDDLLDKVWEQQGRCFYSGIPLVVGYGVRVEWKYSITRVDRSEKWTRDNVVLVCEEFSKTKAQWSRDKFHQFLTTIEGSAPGAAASSS